MAKKKIELDFPRTLYKPAERNDPAATKWGSDASGGAFHSLLVNDEKECKAGLQLGYVDDFAKGRSFDYEEPEEEEETNDAESNDTAEADSEEPDGETETEINPDEDPAEPDETAETSGDSEENKVNIPDEDF